MYMMYNSYMSTFETVSTLRTLYVELSGTVFTLTTRTFFLAMHGGGNFSPQAISPSK